MLCDPNWTRIMLLPNKPTPESGGRAVRTLSAHAPSVASTRGPSRWRRTWYKVAAQGVLAGVQPNARARFWPSQRPQSAIALSLR